MVFRPQRNAARMAEGAARLLMSPISEEVFMDGINQTVRGNASWVPPSGKGTLYLRPLYMGTGEGLGEIVFWCVR